MRTPQPIPRDASQQARDAWATATSAPVTTEPASPPQQPNRSEKASRLGCVALEKSYRKGDLVIPVLRGVDLEVTSGEFLSVSGQSGSGKSTLLHVLGLLDAPNVGEVHCDGRRIDNLTEPKRDELRTRTSGSSSSPTTCCRN